MMITYNIQSTNILSFDKINCKIRLNVTCDAGY